MNESSFVCWLRRRREGDGVGDAAPGDGERERETAHKKTCFFDTLFFSKALGKNRIAARLFPRYFLLNFDHEAKRVHRDCRDAPARADLDEKD